MCAICTEFFNGRRCFDDSDVTHWPSSMHNEIANIISLLSAVSQE